MMNFMRKVKIFLRGMAHGMDVTAIFGGRRTRLRLGRKSPNVNRIAGVRIGDQSDDWASAGRDLFEAMRKHRGATHQ